MKARDEAQAGGARKPGDDGAASVPVGGAMQHPASAPAKELPQAELSVQQTSEPAQCFDKG